MAKIDLDSISVGQLKKVIALKKKIQTLQGQLGRILKSDSSDANGTVAPAGRPRKKRGGMSASARRKIAEAQRRRWAACRKAKG